MTDTLADSALDQLFRTARTYNGWQEKSLDRDDFRDLYQLLRFGPTSANQCPARFIFVTSDAGKQRLKPCLAKQNQAKTMAAPVCVIVAMDMEFYDKLPELFPHTNARSWFAGKPEAIQENAFRNSALQGAYLIMAARALGYDCGPMSGFDAEQLKAEFFPNRNWQANFICNIGYGDRDSLMPRSPRLSFEDACEVV